MRASLRLMYSLQSSINIRDLGPLCATGVAAGHGPNKGRRLPCLSALKTSASHPRWRHLPCLVIPVAAMYWAHSSSRSRNWDCMLCTSSIARSSLSAAPPSPHLGRVPPTTCRMADHPSPVHVVLATASLAVTTISLAASASVPTVPRSMHKWLRSATTLVTSTLLILQRTLSGTPVGSAR